MPSSLTIGSKRRDVPLGQINIWLHRGGSRGGRCPSHPPCPLNQGVCCTSGIHEQLRRRQLLVHVGKDAGRRVERALDLRLVAPWPQLLFQRQEVLPQPLPARFVDGNLLAALLACFCMARVCHDRLLASATW